MIATTNLDTHAYIIESLKNDIPNLEFLIKTDKENPKQNMESIVLVIDKTDNIKVFFDQLFLILSDSLTDKYICKKLEFNIFALLSDHDINNGDLPIYLKKLKDFFKKVSLFKLKHDEYQNEITSNLYLLKVFDALKNKDISLFLTPNMLIKRSFFKKIFNYCNFSDKFLISGAQVYNNDYLDGQEFFSIKNSTVCLYATGHPAFHSFTDVLRLLIEKDEIFKFISLNFLIDAFVTSLKVNFRSIPEKNQDICRYIITNYKYNNYILNVSSNMKDGYAQVMKIPAKLSIYASNIQPGIYYKQFEDKLRKIFDPKFYLKTYPFTKDFLINQQELSTEDKLFRHYMMFGLNYGFWANEDLYKKNKIDYK